MIGFSLTKTHRPTVPHWGNHVVTFTDEPFLGPDCSQISGPDQMPETFYPGLHWRDLNIMEEAYVEGIRFNNWHPLYTGTGQLGNHHYADGGRDNLGRLYQFIRAFDLSKGCWMYVWKAEIEKQLSKGMGT